MHHRHNMASLLSVVLLPIFVLLLTGCASSIPDAKPFGAATITIRDATRQHFRETIAVAKGVHQVISEIQIAGPDDKGREMQTAKYEEATSYLTELENVRLVALNGLVDYSRALVNTAEAGREKVQQIKATAEAAGTLISKVGEEIPAVTGAAAPLVAEGLQLFRDAAQRALVAYRINRTNKDLLEKLNANAVAVDQVAEALAKDLTKLSDVLTTLEEAAAVQIRYAPSPRALREAMGALVERRNALAKQRKGAGTQSATAAQPATEPDLAEIVNVESQIAIVEMNLAPYVEQEADTRRSIQLAAQAVLSTRDSIAAWRKAHEDLRLAIIENSRLSTEELLAAAEQVKADAERFRAFRDKVRDVR